MISLEQGLKTLGIPQNSEKEEKLHLYLDELEFWNQKYGLVKVENRQDLLIRHLLDSLSGLKLIQSSEPETVADLGSGAGFPGIPLAIYMPQCHFTLVERQGRRCRFLENTILQLSLDNVEVFQGDLKQLNGPFDLITFRAFRPFEEEILKHILRNLAPEGRVAAYKGKLKQTRQEWGEIEKSFSSGSILPLQVPGLDAQRCMLWMKGK